LAPEHECQRRVVERVAGFNEGAPSLAPERILPWQNQPTNKGFNEGAPSLAPEL